MCSRHKADVGFLLGQVHAALVQAAGSTGLSVGQLQALLAVRKLAIFWVCWSCMVSISAAGVCRHAPLGSCTSEARHRGSP